MKNVTNKKITILGAARSGIAAALLLKEQGAVPFVSDMAAAEKRTSAQSRLQQSGIACEFGGHSEKIFDAECMVLSPGIPVRSQTVQAVLKRGIPVYSEIEVASWFYPGKLIAVTGSNGKTTTTTLIGEMLKQTYPKAVAAGNIGSPFAAAVRRTDANTWSVVEVSSFQLETIASFHPQQAVVLNFAPNHLDRYDSYEDYLKAKWRVTKNLTKEDICIYNHADEKLSAWAAQLPAKTLGFDSNGDESQAAWFDGSTLFLRGEPLIAVKEMQLRGVHNYMNAMAAALAAHEAGVPLQAIRSVLKTFSGVEHRLEFVAEKNKVRFINDSKATTVESLSYALQSFDAPIYLIAGGKDKGSDFTKLNELIRKHVKQLILIGTAADKMEAAWGGLKPVFKPATLKEAVEFAAAQAKSGEVVLLSPACASFDMFSDFEDRGRQFKQLVKDL